MASINLQGDTSGSISISAPSVAGSNTLTLPATTQTLATQNALGVRNLIINGDMRIDQRNAGASVTPTNGTYTLDRMKWGMTQTSKFTVQQVSDAPADFQKSLKVTSSSAYSILSTDYFFLDYVIEGNMMEHLNWGTSDAKTVTLSFWVKSSLTGTFGGTVLNTGALKNYVFSYTIDSANTWEKKEITIEGETTSTWGTGTSAGMYLRIAIGAGSGTTGTAGSWGSLYRSVTGQTNVLGTSGATWQITGLQLEADTDTATPFEHRPYDMELARCQRYYYRIDATVAGSYPSTGAYAISTTQAFVHFPFPVVMRATPTAMETSGTASDYRIVRCGLSTYADCNLVPTITTSMPHMGMGVWKVASGLSNGTAGGGNFATTSGYVGWSAEL